MKYRSKKVLAAAGATLAVAAGAGGALASGTRGSGGPANGTGPIAIASYLGLTPAELRAQLRSGKTLAQIALAQGKTVAGLEDAIYADVQAHLDRAVAIGELNGTQEQAMLAQLKAHLDDIVNHASPGPGMLGQKRPAFGRAVASYLGITAAELRTQLRAGKSLAQIATAQGKSVDGLKAAILAAAKAKLDRAVTSDRLTTTQEKTILDRLAAHLDELVNRTRP
jgi:hypothetical protein